MQRTPWWKRNVRNDYLCLKLTDCTASTSTFTNQSFEKYVLQAKALDVVYFENENSFPIDIGKVGIDDKCSHEFGLIKYAISFC